MSRISRVVAVLSVTVVVACGGANFTSQDPLEFQQTAGAAGVVVIDVRTPAEFAAGHLANAVNIDVEGPDFDSQIATLDRAATYAVYCHSGRRSTNAANMMVGAGFTHVFNLKGGIQAWTAAGLPVTQ